MRGQSRLTFDARMVSPQRWKFSVRSARIKRDEALADARAANTVSERLRQRVGELTAMARAASNPAAISGSATAGDPLDVLAVVVGRLDQRAGELADYADRARIAGQACEGYYDALNGRR